MSNPHRRKVTVSAKEDGTILVYDGGWKDAIVEPTFNFCGDRMTVGCTTITREAWRLLEMRWQRNLRLIHLTDDEIKKL